MMKMKPLTYIAAIALSVSACAQTATTTPPPAKNTLMKDQPVTFETAGFAAGATCGFLAGSQANGWELVNEANKVVTIPLIALPGAEIWCESAQKNLIPIGVKAEKDVAKSYYYFVVRPYAQGTTRIKLGAL